jgi:hypothetical protein
MPTHYTSWVFLLVGCAGVMVLLAGVGLLAFILLRRKNPPRGFDVLPKK